MWDFPEFVSVNEKNTLSLLVTKEMLSLIMKSILVRLKGEYLFMKSSSYSTLDAFRSFFPVMVIFSILSLGLVVVAYLGVPLPFQMQTFESTGLVRIATLAAGILGLAAAFLGRGAAAGKNSGLLKVSALLSIVMIGLYCAIMFLADGHTSPHVWIAFGFTSIIPATFGGYALRLALKGWDDTCG